VKRFRTNGLNIRILNGKHVPSNPPVFAAPEFLRIIRSSDDQ
jgi:hypothetical protein